MRPIRCAPLGASLLFALLASAGCREPHTAQTNLAGESAGGQPFGGPLEPSLAANGKLTVTDARIKPLKQLFHELTLPEHPDLAWNSLGHIEAGCFSTVPCSTDADCVIPPTCTDAGRCGDSNFRCTTNADCARPVECSDGLCRHPGCEGWSPVEPLCFGSAACNDAPEASCMTLYWDRTPGDGGQGPENLPAPAPSVNFNLLSVIGAPDVGCASTPVDLNLPSDLLGEFPPLRLEKEMLPTIARYTTLGTPSPEVCAALDCGQGAVNAAGLWFHARIVPETPIERQITCVLGSPEASDPVCAQFLGAIPGAVNDALTEVGCSTVRLSLRLERLPLRLGLIPALPAPGGGAWTSGLFPGAKDFHLEDMFQVVPVVAGTPTLQLGSLSSSADVSVKLELLADDWQQLVCDGIFFAAQGYVYPMVEEELRVAIGGVHRTVEGLAGDLLSYEEEGLPEATDIAGWVSASMTYQKWQWFASPFGPYGQPYGQGWLPVTGIETETDYAPCDGAGAALLPACDGATTTIRFLFDPDMDGDGIPTAVDPAPTCNTQVHLDSDDDGVVDACDDCPDDPYSTSDQLGAGGDGDGVCGDRDNCPGVFNPDQSNCNADAERVYGYDVLGDACDPVPCPRVSLVYDHQSVELYQCKALSRVDVQPLVPQPVDLGADPVLPPDWKIYGVKTSAWFCADDPSGVADCFGDASIDEDWMYTSSCAPSYPGSANCFPGNNNDPETAKDWFHRVDLVESTDHRVSLDYVDLGNGAPVPLHWSWESDAQRWLNTGLISADAVEGQPLSGTLSMRGRLWLHAQTPQGSKAFPVPSLHGDDLSSSYTDLVTAECKPNPWFEIPVFSKCLIDPASCLALPWKPDMFINPWDLVARFDAASKVEASVIVQGASGRAYGALLGSGLAELVDDRLGRGARALLDQPGLTWVAASEASLAMGKDPAAPSALAFGADGRLAGALTSVGSRLLESADLRESVSSDAVPLASFEAAYARSRGRVFAVGRSASGRETQVWSLDLATGAWSLRAAVPGGTVVAATYAYATDTVAWLEVSGGARLYTMDADGGPVALAWEGATDFAHHHLAADVDGRLVLAAWSEGAGYTLQRLGPACADPPQPDKGATLWVTAAAEGDAALPFAPMSDVLGLTVVEVDPWTGAGRSVRVAMKATCAPLSLATH
ncbi:MAG: hypothetical protein AMXMBFR64_00480 [Myxococcales bacterium]